MKSTLAETIRSGGATPKAAAAYAAGLAYLWVEAVVRYLGTNTNLGSWYWLYPQRTGDVSAIWFTSTVVSLVVFFVLTYGVFRGKPRVGSIKLWTILLVLSAVIAPLIGEIGTPFGI